MIRALFYRSDLRLASAVFAVISTALLPLPVLAQQNKASAQEVPRPPVLEKLDESEPVAPIKPQSGSLGGQEIGQRREQGKVKEVQVQAGKSNYSVTSNEAHGSIQPGEGGVGNSKPAQWKLLEFDFGAKKDKKEPDSPNAAPAPPTAK